VSRIVAVARDVLYRLRMWSPDLADNLKDSLERFAAANADHWPPQEVTEVGILVEGHLSQYGPNYAFRVALAARALQEKLKLGIEVVHNGYSYQWTAAREFYQSFGIDRAVYLGTAFLPRNIMYFLWARLVAYWHRTRLKSGEDILGICVDGIRIGDLIYDDIIRGANQKTVEDLDGRVTRAIAYSIFYYLQYRHLLRSRNYAYYIATHTSYSEYGLLCRTALARGVKVIETTDIHMSFFEQISNDQLPTYHEGVRNVIKSAMPIEAPLRAEMRARALHALGDRMNSRVDQIDVKNAYSGRVYDRQSLSDVLTIDPEKAIVFVPGHVFSDAPHLSTGMLHADYYRWLVSTLDIAVRSEGIAWIIKPHPSSEIYGEVGMVEEMVARLESDHVLLCPPDLNVKSIQLCADALVTVHGTAGLEFACLGVPVVLAGRPFYAGWGFTIEPGSVAEYEETLLALDRVGPLTDSQIERALEVYAIWSEQFDWNNPIITSDVLANVWGNGVPRDLDKAYAIMTDNLGGADPRELKLWRFAQSVAQR
jgi:hypothetical protein